MKIKEFLNLAEKYELGLCSHNEEKILFDYCEKVQDAGKTVSWSISEEEVIKKRILQRIYSTIREDKPLSSRPKLSLLRWSAAAAIVVLVAVTTAILFHISRYTDIIPENVITLELSNGKLINIDDYVNKNIEDKHGNVLAYRHPDMLDYMNDNSIDQLSYHTLKVPYGKTFELQLSDGTKVYLNAGTSIKYPVRFIDGTSRNVFISGEAFLEVAKDVNHLFVANSEFLSVQVLGTKFNMHAYSEDNSVEVVLVEGAVSINTENGQESDEDNFVSLEPGYMASFHKATNKVIKSKVATSNYTSWINGELIIRNMTFADFLNKLERNYNVTIVSNNPSLANEVFNGNFGKDPDIEEVLEEFCITYGISYTVENNIITIN